VVGPPDQSGRLGTSIVHLSGRSPTSIAMHALTLDHLTGGRVVLEMGVSGPQVVEGWYGAPFSKPHARTREVVEIVRKVLAREAPVTNDGPCARPARDPVATSLRSSRAPCAVGFFSPPRVG